jgi:hypothetical protein
VFIFSEFVMMLSLIVVIWLSMVVTWDWRRFNSVLSTFWIFSKSIVELRV